MRGGDVSIAEATQLRINHDANNSNTQAVLNLIGIANALF